MIVNGDTTKFFRKREKVWSELMGRTEHGMCKSILPGNQVHKLECWANIRGLIHNHWFAKCVTKFWLVIRHQTPQSCDSFGLGMMANVLTKKKKEGENCLEMSLQCPASNSRGSEWHFLECPFPLGGINLLLLRLVLIILFASHHLKYSQFTHP